VTEKRGVQRIVAIFEQVGGENRAALMPYLTLGYPTPEKSLALVEAAVAGGADLLELGVPFSDPLADGPTIQQATHVALKQGVTVARCLEMVQELRQRGITVPFIFMGYYNPILTYGEAAFCRACREVGVDGLIVPDLPPEEGELLEKVCCQHGLAMIYLLAPTSPPDRVGHGHHRRSRASSARSGHFPGPGASSDAQAAGGGLWHLHSGASQTGGSPGRWRHRR
jgi:tryptophan synthase alpha chain